jgi:hypothetical protein
MTNDPRLIEAIHLARRTIDDLLASDEAALSSLVGDALDVLSGELAAALTACGCKLEG